MRAFLVRIWVRGGEPMPFSTTIDIGERGPVEREFQTKKLTGDWIEIVNDDCTEILKIWGPDVVAYEFTEVDIPDEVPVVAVPRH